MIEITDKWICPLNILTIAIFILFLIRGWKRGIVRELLALAGTVLTFYFSWTFGKVLAEHISIMPASWNPFNETALGDTAAMFMNRVIWFLIVFILLRIIFSLIDKAIKKLHHIPVIHTVSGIAGAIMAGIEACIVCLVVCIVLCTPLFKNGANTVSSSYLGVIRDKSTELFSAYVQPVSDTGTFQKFAEDISKMSEEEKNNFSSWLDSTVK